MLSGWPVLPSTAPGFPSRVLSALGIPFGLSRISLRITHSIDGWI